MTHTRLGTIVKCQVSAQGLIQEKRYIDSDIIDATELHLSADGVVGWCDGRAVLNHHHRLNPRLRTWKPHRLLSIGFTGHYNAMADRFGDAPVGCAAENIIVDLDEVVALDDVSRGLQVRTAAGEHIDLEGATVAKPCVPFTKYLLNDQDANDETVAPNRAFLDNGIRGFVMGLANHIEPVTIRPGDEVWALS
ncbi:MAG: hypothetical protein AAGA65_10675 [Actinomycetota bacterium]